MAEQRDGQMKKTGKAASWTVLCGIAVLLVSADLSEIKFLSDRIAVMYEGRIVGIVDADKTTVRELGLMMTGVSQSVAAFKKITPIRKRRLQPLQICVIYLKSV